MGRKTYNPYRLKTTEITRFRGIANADNEQMVPAAYVEGMNNLTAFRVREMTPRKGQSRSTEYSGGILAGKKTLKQVVTVEGSDLHTEAIRDNLTPTAGFDFIRDVTIPDNTDGTFLIVVLDSVTGDPVHGATVTILDGSTEITSRTIPDTGFVQIEDMDSNTLYTIQTEADEYPGAEEDAYPSAVTVTLTANDESFRFTIETAIPSQVITLPLVDSTDYIPVVGAYNFTVDWGDGNSSTVTAWDDSAKAHTYASAGTYQVAIAGTCPVCSWGYAEGEGYTTVEDTESVVSVENLGVLGWTDLSQMFAYCENLLTFDAGYNDTSSVIAAYSLFDSCSSLVTVSMDIDLSSVEDMAFMFADCALITSLDDVSWTLSAAFYAASGMFWGATLLSSIPAALLDGTVPWYMDRMFEDCSSLVVYDFSSWDFSARRRDLRGIIGDSALNTSSYDSLLIALDDTDSGWADKNPLGADGVKYSAAGAAAHASLISKGWTIVDGGLA